MKVYSFVFQELLASAIVRRPNYIVLDKWEPSTIVEQDDVILGP